MDEGNTIDNVGSQTLGKSTVAGDLAFSVVLKVTITLEAALDELTELGGKELGVVEVVNS